LDVGQAQKYDWRLCLEMSIKDHPFLKEAEQHNEVKLQDFLERISGSKLSAEEKKIKKDI
jgi:hypothetical protein